MVRIIVAVAANNGIGKNNNLLWHLPADMRFFTQNTKDNIVVMGRKNWDSIPEKYRPLPKRLNAVITRREDYHNPDADVFNGLEEAIAFYQDEKFAEKDIYIIGGGEIYAYALQNDLVDDMLVTHVHQEFEADVFFPQIDDSKWNGSLLFSCEADEKNPHDFDVIHYTKKEM